MFMNGRVLFCAAALICVGCQPKPSMLQLSDRGATSEVKTLTVDLQDSQKRRPVAIQWSFLYSPSIITQVSIYKGTQLTSSNKHLTCSSILGRTNCVIWSSDKVPIQDGDVALARFTLSKFRSPADAVIGLREVAASSGDGIAVPLATPQDNLSPEPPLTDRLHAWTRGRYLEARSIARRVYHYVR